MKIKQTLQKSTIWFSKYDEENVKLIHNGGFSLQDKYCNQREY